MSMLKLKTIKQIICIVFITLSINYFGSSYAVSFVSWKLQHQSSTWQLIIKLTGLTQVKSFSLQHPNRVVLDLNKVILPAHKPTLNLKSSPILKIRSAIHDGKNSRIVLDLKDPLSYHIQQKKDAHKNYSLIIVSLIEKVNPSKIFGWEKNNLFLPAQSKVSVNNKRIVRPSQVLKTKKKVVQSLLAPQNKPRDVIVVIDPGHGGKDPGATGRGGTHEKNIVLALSKFLDQYLNKTTGFHAYLTRTGDYYLTLRQRLAIARKYKADMFIAIHADAYLTAKAHGASVFALSQKGATSEAARWIAEKENKSELMGGVDLSDKSHLLKSVLIDLSQSASTRSSLKIGQQLLASLRTVTNLHHNKVEQAAFVVLKSPDIPSLLVETGFLSNPREERRLNYRSYQQRLAMALKKGIVHYFKKTPPRNTWLAYYKHHPTLANNTYIVARGDTLSQIAIRYGISWSTLKKANHLNSDRIHIGQKLHIAPTN